MASLLGIITILVAAWLLSTDRKNIPLRTVSLAFLLQISFALLVLYVPMGKEALNAATGAVSSLINYGQEGINFLFGGLTNNGFVFAINVLGIIIFFSALISGLYHIGFMPKVINLIGGALQKFLGTGRAESLSATANIFVGMIEAPLVVKPYLKHMTDSQLFAVMVCGLASVAGGTLVGYASLGVDLNYLIAAAFMSAPAGLLMAKILVPGSADDVQENIESDVEIPRATNVVEAMADGAMSGLRIAVAVGATLLAFISVIAMLNGLLGIVGGWFGVNLSFELLLGYVFAPVAWLIGVPWSEAVVAGSLIGNKIVVNEFVAFIQLMDAKEVLSEHSQAIVTFALCGFANISTMAILIGGLGSLVPERRSFISQYGFKAICAGVFANLMSAAIAGVVLSL
ncbi:MULTISPECIES: NupC/NupG family nucleoside CNT transporter [Vibrio]|jgi:CNT family concentrative nucleoside transporter|uniref:Nucleoside permease n=2 Tax=Vibrio TaxID=662 RepID=A0A2S7VG05_9VIBR|nr:MULTISPECIES: NupC/NupG family nucleoside CNT transporter [Vibrio]MCG9563766.1 NupC/NupG family nucleoside CNT transporter [Vibrio chagasii]MCG9692471.1 NupC/NupG family nucleoside CNT transporter [Vibrio sp. Isolate22]NOH32110.1 NupC/NupG family nucleoside CNT transporter [Vibrio chagasii]PML55752.1 transporter [Vibrio sp. 10N.261.52.A1]PQJ61116.1 transporter [Vibrio chagasii]|tara:strand:+ start:1649 stop:2848 length:1200 start_codon:yes stop_codon:yes gene_type:complete